MTASVLVLVLVLVLCYPRSDFFYYKGMYTAAHTLGLSEFEEEAERACRKVFADVAAHRFYNDQPQTLQVVRDTSYKPQGLRMVTIGGCTQHGL